MEEAAAAAAAAAAGAAVAVAAMSSARSVMRATAALAAEKGPWKLSLNEMVLSSDTIWKGEERKDGGRRRGRLYPV